MELFARDGRQSFHSENRIKPALKCKISENEVV